MDVGSDATIAVPAPTTGPVTAVTSPVPPVVPAPLPPPTGQPGVYRGGQYEPQDTELTSPIATPSGRRGGTVYGGQQGAATTANADAPIDSSGSLTGMILARGRPLPPVGRPTPQQRARERRALLRRVAFIALGAVIFITAIAATVAILAGDFIRSLFHTLS